MHGIFFFLSTVGNHKILSGVANAVFAVVPVVSVCGWVCVCLHAKLGWGGEQYISTKIKYLNLNSY